MIKNVGIVINVDGNVKKWLIKVGGMMDLFGILVFANAIVINRAMLENI